MAGARGELGIRVPGTTVRAVRRDLERRWVAASHRRRAGRIRLTGRHWSALVGFAVTATLVAVGLGSPERAGVPVDRQRVAAARAALASLPVLTVRPPHDGGYRREAFGPAWSDDAGVGGADNGCDTRNDVLARDLAVGGSVAVSSCTTAVAAGRLRSPYTGRELAFTRGRGSAAVQIDHIVPLAYAWDMGARDWPPARRMAFANDPANLLAVDAASNQAKSDSEPGRWMPELRGFWCQYAIAFVVVSQAYALPVDRASRDVLARALAGC